MTLNDRIAVQQRFWDGDGPSLMLMPAAQPPEQESYKERFGDPEKMWGHEIRRAEAVSDWPTDGIPTIRPSLGVIFIPAIAGQEYLLNEHQMPWPGKPMDKETIRRIPEIDVGNSELMQRAMAMYQLHAERGDGEIVAYHADTQGVFDVAHLLYGDEIFYDMADGDEWAWIEELMTICLDLYVNVSNRLRAELGQQDSSMIHGHARPQGVYFPTCGVRLSEDTAILISPEMIDEVIIPYIEQSIAPFGAGFVHFCGYHEHLYEASCASKTVHAIDLGNNEMYDTRWLFERAAETDTVLFTPIASLEDEKWPDYVNRIGNLVKETGVRAIISPAVCPTEKSECEEMLGRWHELTS